MLAPNGSFGCLKSHKSIISSECLYQTLKKKNMLLSFFLLFRPGLNVHNHPVMQNQNIFMPVAVVMTILWHVCLLKMCPSMKGKIRCLKVKNDNKLTPFIFLTSLFFFTYYFCFSMKSAQHVASSRNFSLSWL